MTRGTIVIILFFALGIVFALGIRIAQIILASNKKAKKKLRRSYTEVSMFQWDDDWMLIAESSISGNVGDSVTSVRWYRITPTVICTNNNGVLGDCRPVYSERVD